MNLSPQANPKKSIFLVEDDLALSCLIRDFLERYQFSVSVFSNGAEAAKEILRCQPDLVILDIMLPEASYFLILVPEHGNNFEHKGQISGVIKMPAI